METKDLIQALREDAEWARGNEWETPITLGDNLTEAADRLGALLAENERLTIKLQAYKDTGLTPEEVAEYKKFEDEAVSKGVPFSRIVELMNADKDGRLMVLPCKVGDTVYFVLKDSPYFYPDTNGWYIGESRVRTVTDKGFCDGEIGVDCIIPWDELGKTVFLTREEADRALMAALRELADRKDGADNGECKAM